LSVTAFVQPISGEVFWYVSNGVSKPFFAARLALFAREAGAGRERIIVLGLDSAGWHTAPNLVVPDGIRLADLPPYSPELQPAEHLWPILDEPLANRYFATLADLERTVADRCRVLDGDQLSLGTNFHGWPKPATPSSSAGDRIRRRTGHLHASRLLARATAGSPNQARFAETCKATEPS
jgi:transposase